MTSPPHQYFRSTARKRQAIAAITAGTLSVLTGALPFVGRTLGFPLGLIGISTALWAYREAEPTQARFPPVGALCGLVLGFSES